MRKPWTIYACTHDGCNYYRDTFSTGVHVVGAESRERHSIAAVEVIPADSPNVLSEEEAQVFVALFAEDVPEVSERARPILRRLSDFAEGSTNA